MKWFLQRVLALVAAVVVVVAALGILLRMQYAGDPAAWAVSDGSNALWLAPDGSDDAAASLPPDAVAGQISDVYLYAGAMAGDGALPEAAVADATGLLDLVTDALPDARVSAWALPAGENADLTDELTRERIAESARALVDAGFDGVHFDVAEIRNNAPGLVPLLEATREALPEDAVLSAAAPRLEPLAGMGLPLGLIADDAGYWSTTYLSRVADNVDQVALRTDRTGMPLDSLYGGLVAQQAQTALETVPEDVDLFVGFPDPAGDTAETAEATARGARLGLTDFGEERPGFGLAVHGAGEDTPWPDLARGWATPEE